MPAPRKFNDETKQKIYEAFHSDRSGPDIAKEFGCDYSRTIRKLWANFFGEEAVRARFRRMCAISKIGELNPMSGKVGTLHHNYSEVVYTPLGYKLVPAPEWYTGPMHKTDKVAEHIIVACAAYGYAELPPFCIVHHKDENKLNNHPDNLEIMNRGQHMVTHRWLRHQKKVQRLSHKGVGQKAGRSAQRPDEDDDIVCPSR